MKPSRDSIPEIGSGRALRAVTFAKSFLYVMCLEKQKLTRSAARRLMAVATL